MSPCPLPTRLTHSRIYSLEEKQLSQPEGGRAPTLNKRQVAYLSPRLGVLNNIPFAIPFDVRVGIFRRFVLNDMQTRGPSEWRGPGITIRRDHVSQDGFHRLGEVDLRSPIAITFVDQFGQEESIMFLRRVPEVLTLECAGRASMVEACSRSS